MSIPVYVLKIRASAWTPHDIVLVVMCRRINIQHVLEEKVLYTLVVNYKQVLTSIFSLELLNTLAY